MSCRPPSYGTGASPCGAGSGDDPWHSGAAGRAAAARTLRVVRHPDNEPAIAPPPSVSIRGTRPQRELLTAWLLVLLESGASYGYDLRRELDARDLNIDPSALYRALRRLERDGWVQSRWMNAKTGPRRRFYKLTAEGRRNLDEMAVLIKARRNVHDAFLQAHALTKRDDGAPEERVEADDQALQAAKWSVS